MIISLNIVRFEHGIVKLPFTIHILTVFIISLDVCHTFLIIILILRTDHYYDVMNKIEV